MEESRTHSISIGGKELNLPTFFPSISSVKSNLSTKAHVDLLISFKRCFPQFTTQFLISAFDLKQYEQEENLKNLMDAAIEQGILIVIDSGYYEAYWKERQCEWGISDLHKIVKNYPCDIAFCFDNFDEQNKQETMEEHARVVIDGWEDDKKSKSDCLWIPIIHSKNLGETPQICKAVCTSTEVKMIAIPDRELGNGLYERIETIDQVRKELNTLDKYIPLHILGTGHPTSITLYASAGADSFDGLEWCREFIDHETGQLFHSSLTDFFDHKINFNHSDRTFQENIMIHNYLFYHNWMATLQTASKNKEILKFCSKYLAPSVFKFCKEKIKRMTDES